jgi:hypothetical protein
MRRFAIIAVIAAALSALPVAASPAFAKPARLERAVGVHSTGSQITGDGIWHRVGVYSRLNDCLAAGARGFLAGYYSDYDCAPNGSGLWNLWVQYS